MRSFLLFATGISILLNLGCASLSNKLINDAPAQKLTNDSPTIQPPPEVTFTNTNQAERIAVIWKENAFQSTGHQPVQGFTGRVYFYDANDQLLQVNGELTVYGYDDSQTRVTRQADRVFRFPADKFQERYHPSEIGHSYAIWIPWSSEDRIRKSISLVPFFVTADGKRLEGTMNRLVLSGSPPPNESHVEKKVVPSVMYPESRIAGSELQNGQRKGNVTTFQMSQSLAEKMNKLPPNQIQNIPPNRIPSQQVLQHLNDMETVTNNPNGQLYNRTQLTQQQLPGSRPVIRPPVQNPRQNPQAFQATSLNFSDAWETAPPASSQQVQRPLNQINAPADEQPPQRLSSFGKPGSYR